MKISSLIVFLVLFALITLLSSNGLAEEVTMGAADSPNMQMNDQKDIARIETCVGPCLKKYKGAFEFISQKSMRMSGLQVLFIGEYPKLTLYTAEHETKESIDIRDKSAQEIEEILIKAGCRFRKMN